MVKVTLNENLVPCEREPWASTRPVHDLINNIVQAEHFIAAAIGFFELRKNSVRFSGHVRKGNDGLQIKVWDGEQLYRVVRFRHMGYTAVLHVVATKDPIKHCLGKDLVGDLNASVCLAGYS